MVKYKTILTCLCLVVFGCSVSNYKFKPEKTAFRNYFGLMLPTLSEDKMTINFSEKQDDLRKKAVKVKPDEVEEMKRDFFIGDSINFTDYRKNRKTDYQYHKEKIAVIHDYHFIKSPYIKQLNKKINMQCLTTLRYYQNGRLNYIRSVLYADEMEAGISYGKKIVFDKNGDTLASIDYERNFKMDVRSVIKIMFKYIPNSGRKRKIELYRYNDSSNGYWVMYNVDYENDKGWTQLILEDKSQKVINKENTNDTINNAMQLISKYNRDFDINYRDNEQKRFNDIIHKTSKEFKN